MNKEEFQQLICALMRMDGEKEPHIFQYPSARSRYGYTMRIKKNIYINYFDKTGKVSINNIGTRQRATIENKDIINEIGKYL